MSRFLLLVGQLRQSSSGAQAELKWSSSGAQVELKQGPDRARAGKGSGEAFVKSDKEQRLIEALEPVALANGFELVDVELGGSANNRVVRVFLDKEGGIGIEDIAGANHWVDSIVEKYEPYSGSFNLEVSSPGIDRPLRTREHFMRYVGEEARISTESINGRAHWTGIIEGVEGSTEGSAGDSAKGSAKGSTEDSAEDSTEDSTKGSTEGSAEGSTEGSTKGSPEGTMVVLSVEGQSYRLPFEKIKKAHLKVRIDFSKKGVE